MPHPHILRLMRIASSTGALVLISQLLGSHALAEHVWTRNGVGNWQSSFNWSEPYLPDSTTNVSINNGGTAQVTTGPRFANFIRIGTAIGETGYLKVLDAPAMLTASSIIVADHGTATLSITNGGKTSSGFSVVGLNSEGKGAVNVDGVGSTWLINGNLYVDGGAESSINISGGSIKSNSGGGLFRQ
jgi:T5SS/PEP-CTERM-associated repeat protein